MSGETYQIHNYGSSRNIPTYRGNFFLGKGFNFKTKDRRLAKELSSAPLVDVRCFGVLIEKTIQELRRIASSCGIKGSFYMKKAELIKSLGG